MFAVVMGTLIIIGLVCAVYDGLSINLIIKWLMDK